MSAFLAENRWFLDAIARGVVTVLPDPEILGAEHFRTFARINGRTAEITWRVRITTRGELLECRAESLTLDGLELPVDTIRDDEREFAEKWCADNADRFPTEGGE